MIWILVMFCRLLFPAFFLVIFRRYKWPVWWLGLQVGFYQKAIFSVCQAVFVQLLFYSALKATGKWKLPGAEFLSLNRFFFMPCCRRQEYEAKSAILPSCERHKTLHQQQVLVAGCNPNSISELRSGCNNIFAYYRYLSETSVLAALAKTGMMYNISGKPWRLHDTFATSLCDVWNVGAGAR